MATMTVQAADGSGSFSAYVVEPGAAPAGAVVLIQEIFGVNDAMRATAAEVADLGFIAICPDLFWRIQPGIDITDKTEAEWKQAMGYLGTFDQAKGVEDLKATVSAARTMPGCNGHVGTMGYCLGGRLAVMMAASSDADVNVSFYGVGIDDQVDHFEHLRAPLVMHIAGEDGFFPAEGRAKVIAAAKGLSHIQAFNYEGADHGFARVGGTHWHARSAATIANGRSAEALACRRWADRDGRRPSRRRRQPRRAHRVSRSWTSPASWVVPYCTMILSDHGAEVIKVEPPQGDETRDWGPPFDESQDASYFIGVNRNKRGDRARHRQAGRARGAVAPSGRTRTSWSRTSSPGAMERWGLGYAARSGSRCFPGLDPLPRVRLRRRRTAWRPARLRRHRAGDESG